MTIKEALALEVPAYEDHIGFENSPELAVPAPRRIYIAGPMRGYADYNFPAFYEAEDYLTAKGWIVGNPARMDDESEFDYAIMPGNEGIRAAMERDLKWIAKYADAIYMLRGWEKSTGANAEWTLAKTLGLPIYYQETI